MEPFWGVIWFLIWCGINALIATKKGRSGIIFFLASSLPAIPLIFFVGAVSRGNGMIMGVAAFMCPVIGFISAIMADNREEMAVKTGEFGDYRKCPFCAESVRKEAIKCKHCGSDLECPTGKPASLGKSFTNRANEYKRIDVKKILIAVSIIALIIFALSIIPLGKTEQANLILHKQIASDMTIEIDEKNEKLNDYSDNVFYVCGTGVLSQPPRYTNKTERFIVTVRKGVGGMAIFDGSDNPESKAGFQESWEMNCL